MPDLVITRDDIGSEGRYIGERPTDGVNGSIIIKANLGTVYFSGGLVATGDIIAEKSSGIKAGLGIKAGWGITAGDGIEAKNISAEMRIFAGICRWRLPSPKEMEIRAKLIKGTIAYGTLIEPTRTVDEILNDLDDDISNELRDALSREAQS